MHLMIDSGAFSVSYRGAEISLGEYIEFCHELKEMFPDAVVVNLDVIGDGLQSYKNWLVMRSEGLRPLCVFHIWTDTKWLKKYLRKTDHIGLGGMVSRAGRIKDRKRLVDRLTSRKDIQATMDGIWRQFLLNKDKMPAVKVHGMGATGFSVMLRYPWHSVDSTSWSQGSRFGCTLIPRRTLDGEWDYTRPPLSVAFSNQSSLRGVKGKHYENLTEQERKNLLEYITQFGYVMGRSKWKKGKLRKRRGRDVYTDLHEVILEKGVSNWHEVRSELAVEFYSRYIRQVPWPRKFLPRVPPLVQLPDLPVATDNRIKHTILYLSGDGQRIENYLLKNLEEHSHMGILLSYNDLRIRGKSWERLPDLKENLEREGLG